MRFGTFFMTKAKQDKTKCLFELNSINLNLNHRKIWSPKWRTGEKEKTLVALATVLVAVSSPAQIYVKLDFRDRRGAPLQSSRQNHRSYV